MLPQCRTPGDVYTLPHCEVSASEVEGCRDALRAFPTAFQECCGRSEPRDHCLRSSATTLHAMLPFAAETWYNRPTGSTSEHSSAGGTSMPGRLDGKVALVTGGASGIGRATALTFAREGAKLIVADMQEDGGQQTVHMITEQGGEAIFVKTDVPKAVEVQALISKAVETYGRLDCAHNNAGISGFGIAGDAYTLTAEYSEERWHQVIAVNLTGVWLCMKYELQQMLHQGGGAIVNTASVAGLVGLPYA